MGTSLCPILDSSPVADITAVYFVMKSHFEVVKRQVKIRQDEIKISHFLIESRITPNVNIISC